MGTLSALEVARQVRPLSKEDRFGTLASMPFHWLRPILLYCTKYALVSCRILLTSDAPVLSVLRTYRRIKPSWHASHYNRWAHHRLLFAGCCGRPHCVIGAFAGLCCGVRICTSSHVAMTWNASPDSVSSHASTQLTQRESNADFLQMGVEGSLPEVCRIPSFPSLLPLYSWRAASCPLTPSRCPAKPHCSAFGTSSPSSAHDGVLMRQLKSTSRNKVPRSGLRGSWELLLPSLMLLCHSTVAPYGP